MADIFEYDVFLSFASADEEIIKPIWQELCLSGLRVFWSDASLKKEAGNSWFEVIQSSLEKSRHLLLFCTPDSMASKWVKREYSAFFNHCYIPKVRRLIPILMKGYPTSDLPLFFKDIEAWQLEGATSIKDMISILGGINIEELKSENEFLKQNLESLSHEKSTLEAEIKKLNEQLRSQEKKSNVRIESKNSLETNSVEREQSFGEAFPEFPELDQTQAAFDLLGLSSAATSNAIAIKYRLLKEEYEALVQNCPKGLKEICEMRLQVLESSFALIYPLREKEEQQKIDRAFEVLQLSKAAGPTEIRSRLAELKQTCIKATQSSDLFIKQAAAIELTKLEEAGSTLISNSMPSTTESPIQSAAIEVTMPRLAASITEGTIIKWLKKEGDHVERDEPLFEVETDKADFEIPSPVKGTLTRIIHLEGETVEVNTVIALFTK